jgi:hypothetical protein
MSVGSAVYVYSPLVSKRYVRFFSAAGPEKRRLREKADNIVGTGAIRT